MNGSGAPSGPAVIAEVALVLPSFGAGGAERVVLNLAAGLRDTGRRVRLVLLDGRGPLRDQVPDRVEVVDLGRPRARWAGPALVRHLRRRPVDLLIGSQTHVNVLLGAVRPLLPRSTRLVLREPNLLPDADPRSRRDRTVGWALGRADLVVASSAPMRTHLAASVRGHARVTAIGNPVDVDGLRGPVTGGGPWSDGADLRLVAVGRLTEQKAHADLLHLLATTGGRAELVVAGDGPEREALTGLVARLGLAGRVRLVGRIDDPAALATLVATADLMVHPSRFEGMPNAVLEALALGTPVLATTDLRVLEDLAAEVGGTALRLVPRGELGAALAGARPRSHATAPAPSLLPERFRIAAVVSELLGAVETLGRADAA